MDIRSAANSTVAPASVESRSTGTVAQSAQLTADIALGAPVSEPSKDQVQAAVSSMQDYAQASRRDLNFSLEENTGRVVVKVTDSGSGVVIRQIPSEEALELAEKLSEARSLLFKAEA